MKSKSERKGCLWIEIGEVVTNQAANSVSSIIKLGSAYIGSTDPNFQIHHIETTDSTMKLFSILVATIVAGSTAFQPAAKTAQKSINKAQSITPPITRNEMVATNPYHDWNAFHSSNVKGISTGDYVVDRDYTVALTLVAVGTWLTFFGPSKSLDQPCYISLHLEIVSDSNIAIHRPHQHRPPRRSLPSLVRLLHRNANYAHSCRLYQGLVRAQEHGEQVPRRLSR